MLIAPPVFDAKLLVNWQVTSCSCATVIAEELPHPAVLEALNSSIPIFIAPPVCALISHCPSAPILRIQAKCIDKAFKAIKRTSVKVPRLVYRIEWVLFRGNVRHLWRIRHTIGGS